MGQELELELELRELRSLLQVFVVDRYIAIALESGIEKLRALEPEHRELRLLLQVFVGGWYIAIALEGGIGKLRE